MKLKKWLSIKRIVITFANLAIGDEFTFDTVLDHGDDLYEKISETEALCVQQGSNDEGSSFGVKQDAEVIPH